MAPRPQVRRLIVDQTAQDHATEQEAADVVTQEFPKASTTIGSPRNSSAAEVSDDNSALRFDIIFADVANPSDALAARQHQEGDPYQDTTAAEVNENSRHVHRLAWTFRRTGVRTIWVDAEVILDGCEHAHAHAAGDKLRTLELQDVLNQLVLVGGITREVQNEDEQEEEDPEAVVGDERQHCEDPKDWIFDLAEDAAVKRQHVVEDEGSETQRREDRWFHALLAEGPH
mmetsp:Transcript_101/g.357  ORF Transcript_101/g.357 Transcript_101/m.357 type:complete len:229 (+) Transcript_101:323-1009(+)